MQKAERRRARQPSSSARRTHPEVRGDCELLHRSRLILQSAEELEKWLDFDGTSGAICRITHGLSDDQTHRKCGKAAAKSQKKCVQIAKYLIQYAELRKCDRKKQRFFLRKCDAMVVVGDARSSNTGRLAMICEQYCKKVSLVDQADDLEMSLFSGANTVGITAGASTPSWIIKEVNNKMSEEMKVETAMEENFAELLEQSLKTLNNGDKVTGTVMASWLDRGRSRPGHQAHRVHSAGRLLQRPQRQARRGCQGRRSD